MNVNLYSQRLTRPEETLNNWLQKIDSKNPLQLHSKTPLYTLHYAKSYYCSNENHQTSADVGGIMA